MKLSSQGFSSPLFSGILPLCIFLLSLIVRFIYIDGRDIALDEPFSIFHAQMSIPEMLAVLNTGNNPPLYELFLHFWIKIFGIEPMAVRLPSVIFSALTAPVIYYIGQRSMGIKAGVIAAFIFTLSTMHIYFSHEARVYSLFVLLASLSLYFLLRIFQEPGRKKFYLLLFITNLALIYSHYFGFFVLMLEVLSCLLTATGRRALKGMVLVMIGLGIAYLPIIGIFFNRVGASSSGTWVSKPGVTEIYGNLNRFLNNKYSMLVLIIIFVIMLLARFIKKDLGYYAKSLLKDTYRLTIFLWFVVPYLLMFLFSFKFPMFIDRYILYTSIPFYLLIAMALTWFVTKPMLQGAAACILLVSMCITVEINPDNDRRMNEWVETVRSLKSSNTLVILAPDYAALGFAYHYNRAYFTDYRNTITRLGKDNIFPVNSADAARSLLSKSSGDCLYLDAGAEFIDPSRAILNAIASRYAHHQEYFVYKIYYIHRFY